MTVHGTAHLRPLEVDLDLGDPPLSGVEGGLRLGGVADIELLLLRCSGEVTEMPAALCLQPLDLQIGSFLAQLRFVRVERHLKIEGIDRVEHVETTTPTTRSLGAGTLPSGRLGPASAGREFRP